MYLGIDVGTSEVKVLLLNGQHHVVGVAGVKLDVSRPHPGHSEQEPADWWAATREALFLLRQAHTLAFKAVKAIGLSGQMHGAVLLDINDKVLRPAILWNDTRSTHECDEMMAEMPDASALAGSLIMPGFTAPKLRWLAQHEPQIFAQVAKVVTPKDYVRLMLTGQYITDMSDASGTAWLDVAKRKWSPELLALTGMTTNQMPQLVEGQVAGGQLLAQVGADLGLQPGLTVAGGAGDNAASAVGMGAVAAGQGFLSLGTSGVLFLVTPGFAPHVGSATHAFCHTMAGQWHQMSVMLSAASCLQWATRCLGMKSESELENKACQLSRAERALAPLFLPYLGGERTPHNDADLRAGFHGISHLTEPAAMAYSVIEGVTFGLADGLNALKKAGSQVHSLSLVGGGARSAMWAQQLASALNVEILTHAESTAGGALGAARLAWLADGGSVSDVCVRPLVLKSYQPDPAEQALLAPRYVRFKALYPALKSVSLPISFSTNII
jgi:xylulokinase